MVLRVNPRRQEDSQRPSLSRASTEWRHGFNKQLERNHEHQWELCRRLTDLQDTDKLPRIDRCAADIIPDAVSNPRMQSRRLANTAAISLDRIPRQMAEAADPK